MVGSTTMEVAETLAMGTMMEIFISVLPRRWMIDTWPKLPITSLLVGVWQGVVGAPHVNQMTLQSSILIPLLLFLLSTLTQ